MTKALAGRTILAVFAHPDDESISCGGTLARAADAGAHVALVCASHGTLGSISDPKLLAEGDLKAVRARELGAAASVLGIQEVVLLEHEDGYLRWNAPGFDVDLAAALERLDPDAVITFDADGLYWHADHIGMHERTTKAVAALGPKAPPLYYVTLPKGAMHGLVEAARTRGRELTEDTFWGISPDAFGIETKPATFGIDVGIWADRKLAAIQAHRTQVGAHSPFAWIDAEDVERWLGHELFRRAPLGTTRPDVLELLSDGMARS